MNVLFTINFWFLFIKTVLYEFENIFDGIILSVLVVFSFDEHYLSVFMCDRIIDLLRMGGMH